MDKNVEKLINSLKIALEQRGYKYIGEDVEVDTGDVIYVFKNPAGEELTIKANKLFDSKHDDKKADRKE